MTNRIQELEAKLARVKDEIGQEMREEERCSLVMGAYSRLSHALDCLTDEERRAVDGMYLFLHTEGSSLAVDLVRSIPSATDKGQGKKLGKLINQEEAKLELESLAVA